MTSASSESSSSSELSVSITISPSTPSSAGYSASGVLEIPTPIVTQSSSSSLASSSSSAVSSSSCAALSSASDPSLSWDPSDPLGVLRETLDPISLVLRFVQWGRLDRSVDNVDPGSEDATQRVLQSHSGSAMAQSIARDLGWTPSPPSPPTRTPPTPPTARSLATQAAATDSQSSSISSVATESASAPASALASASASASKSIPAVVPVPSGRRDTRAEERDAEAKKQESLFAGQWSYSGFWFRLRASSARFFYTMFVPVPMFVLVGCDRKALAFQSSRQVSTLRQVLNATLEQYAYALRQWRWHTEKLVHEWDTKINTMSVPSLPIRPLPVSPSLPDARADDQAVCDDHFDQVRTRARIDAIRLHMKEVERFYALLDRHIA